MKTKRLNRSAVSSAPLTPARSTSSIGAKKRDCARPDAMANHAHVSDRMPVTVSMRAVNMSAAKGIAIPATHPPTPCAIAPPSRKSRISRMPPAVEAAMVTIITMTWMWRRVGVKARMPAMIIGRPAKSGRRAALTR